MYKHYIHYIFLIRAQKCDFVECLSFYQHCEGVPCIILYISITTACFKNYASSVQNLFLKNKIWFLFTFWFVFNLANVYKSWNKRN